jgi:hypothetical protein
MSLLNAQVMSGSGNGKSKSAPIQSAFSALARVSPDLAGGLANFLWYRTQHRSATTDEQQVLDQASVEVRKV